MVGEADGQALGEVTTGVRSRLELFGQQTRGEASTHVEEVDGFCQHLDEVASNGECFDGFRKGGADSIVSRKAALTAESQSNELASMSTTISSTMAELKARSAQTAENTATLSSNVFTSVSLTVLTRGLPVMG